MSRLSIEVTPEQHNAIKMAALAQGFTIKEFVLERFEHEIKHKSVKKTQSGAGHDDCQLCEEYGGKNRKLKKRTADDMKIAGSYKTTEEMFQALGIKI